MSYGISRPADFDPAKHSEVYVSYADSRNSTSNKFKLVDSTKFLTREYLETDTVNPIEGVYNLKMPIDTFNKAGIYTIYIRPKQLTLNIKDVGVLSAFPDIKGLIISASDLTNVDLTNDSLNGYRIEYYDQNGNKINNFFRIITSSNRCEVVNNNLISTTQKSVSYRFNDSSDLLFLTVTPSSSSNVKPNTLPYIGTSGYKISITNTFFNPIMIEIEMTNNDIETLYTSINGKQIRNLDTDVTTTYDKNNNIFSQSSHYIIKETATGTALYAVREEKEDIDFTEDFNTITGNI